MRYISVVICKDTTHSQFDRRMRGLLSWPPPLSIHQWNILNLEAPFRIIQNSNGDFALNSCKKSAKLLIQCSLRTRYNPFENKLTSRFVLLSKLLILLSNFILNYASNTSPWLIFTLSFAKRMTHSKNIFKGETYLTTSLTIVLRHIIRNKWNSRKLGLSIN